MAVRVVTVRVMGVCAVIVRAVAVRMRMARRRRRQVMIGAKRSVQRKCKHRHDRQRSRKTPPPRTDKANHGGHGVALHWEILIDGFRSVQVDTTITRARTALICGIW